MKWKCRWVLFAEISLQSKTFIRYFPTFPLVQIGHVFFCWCWLRASGKIGKHVIFSSQPHEWKKFVSCFMREWIFMLSESDFSVFIFPHTRKFSGKEASTNFRYKTATLWICETTFSIAIIINIMLSFFSPQAFLHPEQNNPTSENT